MVEQVGIVDLLTELMMELIDQEFALTIGVHDEHIKHAIKHVVMSDRVQDEYVLFEGNVKLKVRVSTDLEATRIVIRPIKVDFKERSLFPDEPGKITIPVIMNAELFSERERVILRLIYREKCKKMKVYQFLDKYADDFFFGPNAQLLQDSLPLFLHTGSEPTNNRGFDEACHSDNKLLRLLLIKQFYYPLMHELQSS